MNQLQLGFLFHSFSAGEALTLEFSFLILLFASVASPWKLVAVSTVVPELEGKCISHCVAFKNSGMLCFINLFSAK